MSGLTLEGRSGGTTPAPRSTTRTRRAGRGPSISWSRAVIYALLLLFTILYLLPIYVVVADSFKTVQEVHTTSIWQPPKAFDFGAWIDALTPPLVGSGGIGSGLRNSVLMTVPAVIVSSLWGSLNGYLLTKWRFRGADFVFAFILFGMFIPYQAILIPLVEFLQKLHLYGTIPGLSLTNIIYGIPITTLIFRNYYSAIPTELVEAANVDGAGIIGAYVHVILPLSVPGFVVVGIWQFTTIWNEFLFGVTLTSDPRVQPVTVSLQNLAGSFAALYNVQMAGAIMTAIPTILAFVFLGRYFIRGLLAGSLKA